MKKQFNFKAARQRRDELVMIYRNLKHEHNEDGTWEWWIMAQIEEIDQEIEAAHARSDSYSNVIKPFVPAWQ